MKQLCIVLICCFTLFQAAAQTRERKDERLFKVAFTGDDKVPATNDIYNRELDSAFQIKKDYTFELRLWSRYLSLNHDNVYILTLKDRKWNARFFNHLSGKFAEEKVDQTNVDKLWGLMYTHKVLTLPNSDSIQSKLVKYELDTVNFSGTVNMVRLTDGVLYSFELKTPTTKKTYEYGNPKFYFREFPNVEELYHVVSLVAMTRKLLGKPILDE